ncbi:unnamed protein product [Moneuplotes crassus]|uniref:Uncharacterized protein n=1 Tax=Euplotes crassus TaxID=5936 RepID=A0AAD1X349_EUPCR|nr:unnamed protein product [Moneuplotes crassus]
MGASNTKIQSSFCCAVERRDCKNEKESSNKTKLKCVEDHQIVDTTSKAKLPEQEKVQNKQSSKEYKKRLMRVKPKSQKIWIKMENKNKTSKKSQNKDLKRKSITGWDKLMDRTELIKFSPKISPAEIREARLSSTSASKSSLHKTTSSTSKPSPFSKDPNSNFFNASSKYSSPSKSSKHKNTHLKIDSCYLSKIPTKNNIPKKLSQSKKTL